jgi:hypothetical protein
MPQSYRIDPEHRLVISRGWGELTDQDSDEQRRELASDPDFHPEFDSLVDLRAVTKVSASPRTIHNAARRSVFSQESRRAIIAPTDSAFGLSRMFGTLAEQEGHERVGVFRTPAAAMEWLGLVPLKDTLDPEDGRLGP